MKENLPVSLQKLIHKVEETFAEDPAMVELFINCFSNTLDTTVKKMEDGTTLVTTVISRQMWLRDSVAQVQPLSGSCSRGSGDFRPAGWSVQKTVFLCKP